MVLRHLPETPGEFEVEVTFAVPDSLTRLEVTLEPEADDVSPEGFDRVGGSYEWSASAADTDRPRITFRMPANRTQLEHRHEHEHGHRSDRDGRHATIAQTRLDGYSFVDTGDWGIVPVPQVQLRYGWYGSRNVSVDRTVEIDGPGVTGGSIAFFGEIGDTYERTADTGETIQLVVPAVSDLRESPDAILDALTHASETLRVGAPNDEVLFVAVPADVDWAADGIQYGDSDAWVTDDSRLDVAHNVWIHEYVHTRQDFAKGAVGTTPETVWLVEAQAEYYAALVTLEQGAIEYDEFRRFLAEGHRSPYADGALAARSTWRHSETDYVKGALVYGAIDRQLRLATDGERTAQNVFRELNLRDEPVTEAAFLSLLEDEGGADVRAFAERYTQTADVPDVWSATEQQAAFAQETAIVGYGLADEPIELSGPVRRGTFEADAVPTLVPGETIAFSVAVENVGERSGGYRATLQVDGRLVDSRDGTLEAGNTVSETVSWTPESAGQYELQVGDRRLLVDVSPFAAGRITDLTIDPTTVEPGDSVTLTATVDNPESVPAQRTVQFRTPSGVVDERTVTIAAGETITVETTVSFDGPGQYEVAVDDQVRTVTVERADLATETREAVDELPGFGLTVALLALAAILGLAFERIRGRRTSR